MTDGTTTYSGTLNDPSVLNGKNLRPAYFRVRPFTYPAGVAGIITKPANLSAIRGGIAVTVTAPALEGYTFDGWYEQVVEGDTPTEPTGTPVCTTLAYTFNVQGNTDLVAKYTANGNATVTIIASNGAEYTVNDSSTKQSGSSHTVQLGTTITITAYDASKVLQWQNESGKVLGRGASLSFTVTGNTSVSLVYNTISESQSFVQFVSDYGQVLSYQQYSGTDNINFPTAPTKFGYNFVKWVFENTETEATETAIKAKIGTAGNSIITIKPLYTKEETKYAVTVKYSGVDRADDTYSGIDKGRGIYSQCSGDRRL